jgi:hypothetical protein
VMIKNIKHEVKVDLLTLQSRYTHQVPHSRQNGSNAACFMINPRIDEHDARAWFKPHGSKRLGMSTMSAAAVSRWLKGSLKPTQQRTFVGSCV